MRPGVKWHALKKGVTTCVGVYGWLLLRDRWGQAGDSLAAGGVSAHLQRVQALESLQPRRHLAL